MSQSNLIRGLLLPTLVWTLSSNYVLKVSAQIIDDLSSNKIEQEQTIASDQDLLQKIEILQQKAESFRETIDNLNIRLQEQYNSQRTSNIVDFAPVLAKLEQLQRIWRDFSQDLETHPELFRFLEEDKVFYDIEQKLIFQKEIISNLEKVLNESSTLTITELQEQLFTIGELNRNYYPYGTFEAKTQHKFALISTNQARELELQISQIANILSAYLLHKEQLKNTNYGIAETTKLNSPDTTKFFDNLSKENRFLNFNTFLALTLLSSCAISIILKAAKQNRSVLQDQDSVQDKNSEPPHKNPKNHEVTDYLNNIQEVENEARKILNLTNVIIEKDQKPQLKNNLITSSKKSNSNFKDARLASNKTFSSNRNTQVIQKLSPRVTSLVTEEDLIRMYRENRQLLCQKSITVEITKESLKRIKTGKNTDILFEEASNGGYWIIFEPKLANNCYFLVPNPILDINSLTLQSIDKIFTCTRYDNRTSDEFNLKYSAMVQVHDSTSWKLIGNGEITFS